MKKNDLLYNHASTNNKEKQPANYGEQSNRQTVRDAVKAIQRLRKSGNVVHSEAETAH